jgi:hypothetical protein
MPEISGCHWCQLMSSTGSSALEALVTPRVNYRSIAGGSLASGTRSLIVEIPVIDSFELVVGFQSLWFLCRYGDSRGDAWVLAM